MYYWRRAHARVFKKYTYIHILLHEYTKKFTFTEKTNNNKLISERLQKKHNTIIEIIKLEYTIPQIQINICTRQIN